VSKPCQDRFLHPILVHSILEKERKYRWPNGAHQKKTDFLYVMSKLSIENGSTCIKFGRIG